MDRGIGIRGIGGRKARRRCGSYECGDVFGFAPYIARIPVGFASFRA